MKRSARKEKAPLWKRIQLERKRKKAVELGLLLFLILFFALAGKVTRVLIRYITTPLEDKKCWVKKSDVDKTNRVNIAFDSEPLLIFSFDKKEKEISVLLIPQDFYFKKETEVCRAGSFFELGEMKDGCGGKFLKRMLADFLAVPIDRYIKTEIRNSKFDLEPEHRVPEHHKPEQVRYMAGVRYTAGVRYGAGIQNIEGVREVIKKIQSWKWFLEFLVNFREVRKNFETDISLLEVFKLWRGVRKIRIDRIFLQDLEKSSAALDERLLDGTAVKTVDSSLLYEKVSSFFKDSRMEGEKIKVEVLNSTREQGLGQKAGLLVTHLGADLIRVGNWPEPLAETQIWLLKESDRNSYTVQRLVEVFEAEVFVKPEIEEARGDLQLLLGEDYSNN